MRTSALASAVGLFCGLIFTTATFAVTITVGPTGNYPPNARPVNITIGTYAVAPILLPPNTSASTKASQIYGALVGLTALPGFPYPNMVVTYTSPNNFVTITGLPKGIVVKFAPMRTGEKDDMQTVQLNPGDSGIAEVGFENDAFASTDGNGNDSVFTAGIITDAGELVETIDESSLPNLEGSTIADALYNGLEPTIASYGAEIVNFVPGDEDLQFLFDSPGTAGIVFGTTAQTDGVFGELGVTPEPASVSMLLIGAAAFFARRHRRSRTARRA